MQHSRVKIFYSLLLASVSATIAGCGAQDSSAQHKEHAKSDDKWLDAGAVELIYDAQIRIDAIDAGEDPFAADKGCETMLAMAQKALSDSSNIGSDVQVMYKTCNDAGLKFQNEVRCKADRLQVLCR